MIGICQGHKERTQECLECFDTDLNSNLILKEHRKLKKEIELLNRKKEKLSEKVVGVSRFIGLADIKHDTIPTCLMDFLTTAKIPSSVFTIIKNKEIAISYLLQSGLYVPNTTCECGKPLNLIEDSNQTYLFVCSCSKTYKFFDRSIWKDYNLTPERLIVFIFLWIMGCKKRDIVAMLGIPKLISTAMDEFLSARVSDYFLENFIKFTGVVEIDESCFRNSRLLNVKLKAQKWVFGLYERSRKLNYMEVVPKRTAKHLIPIIQKTCQPGTTIISDQWAAYNRLEEFGYPHYTVDHSRFFVNPHSREIHTQHIEISWCWAKYEIKRQNPHLVHLQHSLNVFCWKRQFKNADKGAEIAKCLNGLSECIKAYQINKKLKS
jgi:transposase-like protein